MLLSIGWKVRDKKEERGAGVSKEQRLRKKKGFGRTRVAKDKGL